MTLLSVPIAEEDFVFLQTWASKHGTTVESFLAEQAHALRIQLQQPMHPAVFAATGGFEKLGDGKNEHLKYLEEKHS